MIKVIAAIAQNGVIGAGGRLPWHFIKDLQHFKEVTMGHAILFGRKTFESLDKTLPGRKVIVLTNDINYRAIGAITDFNSEIIINNYLYSNDILYIGGGGSIFRQFAMHADEAFITHIEQTFEGDTFFPPDILDRFRPVTTENIVENGVSLRFVKYIKNDL